MSQNPVKWRYFSQNVVLFVGKTKGFVSDFLKAGINARYDEQHSIGKRYRRHDEAGTPFCITIDNDTANDNCVTIRHRDTMEQERVSIDAVRNIIDKSVSIRHNLAKC